MSRLVEIKRKPRVVETTEDICPVCETDSIIHTRIPCLDDRYKLKCIHCSRTFRKIKGEL